MQRNKIRCIPVAERWLKMITWVAYNRSSCMMFRSTNPSGGLQRVSTGASANLGSRHLLRCDPWTRRAHRILVPKRLPCERREELLKVLEGLALRFGFFFPVLLACRPSSDHQTLCLKFILPATFFGQLLLVNFFFFFRWTLVIVCKPWDGDENPPK